MKINEIELASNLASQKLYFFSESLSASEFAYQFPDGIEIETENTIVYTEEAQDFFNTFYDDYLTEIEKTKI